MLRRLRPSRPLALLALLLSLVAPLAAAYLGGDAPDPVLLLPPPPTPGTDEARDDLDQTARVFAQRTPQQVARAQSQRDPTVYCFAPVLGAFFEPGRLPKTNALFARITDEAETAISTAKQHWHRPRPYVVDPARFPDLVMRERSASFPSGHSTRGTLYSIILAELFPAQREALLETGRAIGWARVQIGVHHPSDVYAGRFLGRTLALALLRNPEFQKDLAEVRAEIATVKKD
jgi:acid phosphatase (class A)